MYIYIYIYIYTYGICLCPKPVGLGSEKSRRYISYRVTCGVYPNNLF